MQSARLKDKVALVTGIGAGIGQGCALMFARHGASVMACDIDADSAQRALAGARQEGLAIASLHPCDLTRPADVEALVGATIERFGRIDILVNAAAWGAFKPIEDMAFNIDGGATHC